MFWVHSDHYGDSDAAQAGFKQAMRFLLPEQFSAHYTVQGVGDSPGASPVSDAPTGRGAGKQGRLSCRSVGGGGPQFCAPDAPPTPPPPHTLAASSQPLPPQLC